MARRAKKVVSCTDSGSRELEIVVCMRGSRVRMQDRRGQEACRKGFEGWKPPLSPPGRLTMATREI